METAMGAARRREYKAKWSASARQHAREMRTPDARDVGLAILRLALARAVEKNVTGMVEVDAELVKVGFSPDEARRVTRGLIRRAKNPPMRVH